MASGWDAKFDLESLERDLADPPGPVTMATRMFAALVVLLGSAALIVLCAWLCVVAVKAVWP